MNKKFLKIMELTWLFTAILAGIAIIYSLIRQQEAKDTVTFLLIFTVALLMYFFRRKIRKS